MTYVSQHSLPQLVALGQVSYSFHRCSFCSCCTVTRKRRCLECERASKGDVSWVSHLATLPQAAAAALLDKQELLGGQVLISVLEASFAVASNCRPRPLNVAFEVWMATLMGAAILRGGDRLPLLVSQQGWLSPPIQSVQPYGFQVAAARLSGMRCCCCCCCCCGTLKILCT